MVPRPPGGVIGFHDRVASPAGARKGAAYLSTGAGDVAGPNGVGGAAIGGFVGGAAGGLAPVLAAGQLVTLLGRSTVTWRQTPGVSPNVEAYEIAVEDEEAARAMQGRPVTLTIIPGGVAEEAERRLVVENLYVIGVFGGDLPQTRQVAVADRRYWWPRTHVFGRFNMRRRTGKNMLLNPQTDEFGNIPTTDEVGYLQPSLHFTGRPWTATEVLVEVMRILDIHGVREDIPDLRASLPIEQLELDDPGDQALARVLQYMGGINVYIDNNGSVKFYDSLSRSGEIEAYEGGSEFYGRGFPRLVQNAALRPSKVVVYFTREIEARFDAVERVVESPNLNYALENVLPVPDPRISINGEWVGQGTWVTIEQAIQGWNDDVTTPPPENAGPLTRDVIYRLWHEGMWHAYTWNFDQTKPGGLGRAAVWAMRIAVLRQHFRQTYRIKREWMDGILSFRTNRISIVNVATGDRAASPAWSDYCVVPTEIGGVVPLDARYGINVDGYDTSGAEFKLSTGVLSPLTVSTMDPELGVISLGFRMHPHGLLGHIIPSRVLNVPTAAKRPQNGKPRWWYEFNGKDLELPQLDPIHGVATILTVVPAWPNNKTQFEAIEVTPAEAHAALAGIGAADPSILDSSGPPMELRVGAGMITARYGYQDNASHNLGVKQACGTSAWNAEPIFLRASFTNRDDCVSVAKAMAASVYSGLIDRAVGQVMKAMNPRRHIAGTIDGITWSLNPDGEASVGINLPMAAGSTRNFLSLLPASVRAVILRLVQPL